jgi:hypothetical protein
LPPNHGTGVGGILKLAGETACSHGCSFFPSTSRSHCRQPELYIRLAVLASIVFKVGEISALSLKGYLKLLISKSVYGNSLYYFFCSFSLVNHQSVVLTFISNFFCRINSIVGKSLPIKRNIALGPPSSFS